MNLKKKKGLLPVVGLPAIAIIVFILVTNRYLDTNTDNIISTNGRLEATEINIAPRVTGRIKEIFVNEGDYVTAGQILACMDTDSLNAQLREGQGKLLQAQNAVAISQSRLLQSKSQKIAVNALLCQREAEFEVAERRWCRSLKLVSEGAVSQQTVEDNWATYKGALAAKEAAQAHIGVSDAGIVTAQKEVIGAESAVEATKGSVERIDAEIRDSSLKTPLNGRVQYRVAQPGEVVAAGNPILSLVDLTNVYMTFFLPTAYAGRVAIGEEVRLVLDAAPNYVFPANISYISDVAQFTPKTVETASEREKFMFRVKAKIPPELLEKYSSHVKTGLPGKAFIRLDQTKPWPKDLKVNL